MTEMPIITAPVRPTSEQYWVVDWQAARESIDVISASERLRQATGITSEIFVAVWERMPGGLTDAATTVVARTVRPSELLGVSSGGLPFLIHDDHLDDLVIVRSPRATPTESFRKRRWENRDLEAPRAIVAPLATTPQDPYRLVIVAQDAIVIDNLNHADQAMDTARNRAHAHDGVAQYVTWPLMDNCAPHDIRPVVRTCRPESVIALYGGHGSRQGSDIMDRVVIEGRTP